jgi:DNA/RNA endonuclease G (NUC1)
MEETFFYTNVVPQVGKGFNRGIWKQLEALVRKLAIDRTKSTSSPAPSIRRRSRSGFVPARMPAARN